MPFVTEPTGYEKTAISDLQGSWGNLRDAVVENFGFPDSDRLLFHINEAMSWEAKHSYWFKISQYKLMHQKK